MASLQTDSTKEDRVLFSVGMIADVQYGDADDGFNYTKTRRRRFRPALQIVKNAISVWNDSDGEIYEMEEERPSFIISLGDLIDGLNHNAKTSESAMKTVLTEFSRFEVDESTTEELIERINEGDKIYGDTNEAAADSVEQIEEIKTNDGMDDDAQSPEIQQNQGIDDVAKSKPENQDKLDGNVHIEKPSSNDPDANIVESDTKESVDDNQWIPRFPVFHNLVGNHELYNFDRVQLLDYMHGHRHFAECIHSAP